MIFCAVSQLSAMRVSFIFTMTLPPDAVMTVTRCRSAKPMLLSRLFICGLAFILFIMTTVPSFANASGLIDIPHVFRQIYAARH